MRASRIHVDLLSLTNDMHDAAVYSRTESPKQVPVNCGHYLILSLSIRCSRSTASLHQLAVWPPRTGTRGNRWGDTHVGSAGGPEGASEAGVSGRFLPFLAVLWPLRARNGQKRPETACRRSVAARPPRPCLGAVGYQLTVLGSLEKRRNESKLLDQQPRELLQVKADVK